jgi:hypothetical protein
MRGTVWYAMMVYMYILFRKSEGLLEAFEELASPWTMVG